MVHRVNHDMDNTQRRLLIIQLPMIINERLQVEDEENSIDQVDSLTSCFMQLKLKDRIRPHALLKWDKS